MKAIRQYRGSVLYPAELPTADKLKFNNLSMKDIACEFLETSYLFLMTKQTTSSAPSSRSSATSLRTRKLVK
jgi:hypothetical protein